MQRIITIISAILATMNLQAQRATIAADVHSHIVTKEYMDYLRTNHADMEDGYPLPDWSAEEHLRFMDDAGIAWSVLTMPSPQPYFGDAQEAAKIIRSVNEKAWRTREKYPDRFKFCAALPLPDVNLAIEEAVYALDTLKADGIKLATNSRGQYLGDPALEPLMQVLNDRKATVIIHPHKPTPVQDDVFTGGPIFVYEYPAETTRAVLNMIAHDVLVRYPDLKIIVPHAGSFLPYAIPRLKAAYPLLVAKEIGATSLRTEPGVLTMYAVHDKENPCRITILETYASQEAYKKHIASVHFQRYKQGTLHMVKNLVLDDVVPLNPDNRISNFIRH